MPQLTFISGYEMFLPEPQPIPYVTTQHRSPTGALLLFLVIYIALSAPFVAACHSSWIALSFLEFQITRNTRVSFYKLCEICLRAVETHDRPGSVLLPPSLRCPRLWRQALTRDYITSSSPVSSSTKDSISPLDKILNRNFTL